jgi:hypothetical protein
MTRYLLNLYLALAAIATKTRRKKLYDKILPATELQMRKFSHSVVFEFAFLPIIAAFLAQGSRPTFDE